MFCKLKMLLYLATKLKEMKSKEELEKECWNHFYIHSGVFDYLINKLSELNLLDDLKLEVSTKDREEDVKIATENIIKAIELYKNA